MAKNIQERSLNTSTIGSEFEPNLRSSLIADYQHLSGGPATVEGVPSFVPPSTRWTGTLTYTLHLNGR